MATRAVTIGIRDQAQRDIEAASAVLSGALGVPIPQPQGYEGRDPDYLAAMRLSRIAAFMSGLAAQLAPAPIEPDEDTTNWEFAPLPPIDETGGEEQVSEPIDLTATTEMTRADLESVAAQLGITGAKSLPNKQALIEAINARETELLAAADPDAVPEIPAP